MCHGEHGSVGREQARRGSRARPGVFIVSMLMAMLAGVWPVPAAYQQDDRGFDPTGTWFGMHGPLVLMRAGDTLSFSYSAVFGATAHLCDGAGVAGFAGGGTWTYTDGQGTVSITTRDGGVTMTVTDGIASFCGAYWPGDRFERAGWKPAFSCEVSATRAAFYVVGPVPPAKRPAYVVTGDRVEAADLVHDRAAPWVLARFVGRTATTAGLLARTDLACRPE
ncbi:MAG: hypothetical protein Q7V01_01525 [Vicinamibacterales bacterium]|nr:hypothetical protein [Vicinamibacterales bacterium]